MDKQSRSLLYVDVRTGKRSVFDSMIIPPLLEAGWDVVRASNIQEGLRQKRRYRYDVGIALLDPKSFHDSDETVMQICRSAYSMEWIALLTSNIEKDNRLGRLVSNTFFDYHTMPPDIERLLIVLGHAYGMGQLRESVQSEEKAAMEGPQSEQEMVGVSAAMRNVFRDIRKIANVDVPVLITGETGTGKEIAAKAIHERSRRASGPFIAINCASLPASIIQSELFGYKKGAFAGASKDKVGVIEAANGGTLFLDEIGDLPLELQVNLLRFLQEQTIQHVGDTKEINVDTRVIAATHVDLEKAVEENRFREDLYFRLNVLNLVLPPLRDRREDILLLANYFLRKVSLENGVRIRGFTLDANRQMQQHQWPGNVRELINRIRRGVVMCDGKFIEASDLGLEKYVRVYQPMTLQEVRAKAEREAVSAALHETGYNIANAARILDVSRPALYRLMNKYHIDKNKLRGWPGKIH